MVINLFEYWRFRRCLANNEPYFGTIMAARQGAPVRHGYMQRLVELECSLAKNKNKNFKILEIGSWAGGSAITWAEAIKLFNHGNGTVICVDPWENYIDLTKNKGRVYQVMSKALTTGKIFNLFLHNIRTSKHDDIILPFKGSSDRILPLLKSNQFNIIFVDGAHTYQEVLKDFNNSALLVAEGGVLCGDDIELQMFEIDLENAKKNMDQDFILDPKTGKWFHPGVTLAVGEFFGEVSVYEGFWVMRKRGVSWEKVVWEELDSGNILVPEHLL